MTILYSCSVSAFVADDKSLTSTRTSRAIIRLQIKTNNDKQQ